MSGRVEAIYRHPVKSLGEEAVAAVMLEAGRHMPWDRVWAIAHGGTAFDWEARSWAKARSFVTQTFVPTLARIEVAFDEAAGLLRLTHPDRPMLEIAPETEAGAAALTEWIAPIAAPRQGPFRLARCAEGALTDFPDTHIAINSVASLRALEEAAGASLARIRFRGNIWVEGLAPWQEFEWLGCEITLGEARLEVFDRVIRCNATAANPETGRRDLAVTDILNDRWGHQDFGVYARVIGGGRVAVGDPIGL